MSRFETLGVCPCWLFFLNHFGPVDLTLWVIFVQTAAFVKFSLSTSLYSASCVTLHYIHGTYFLYKQTVLLIHSGAQCTRHKTLEHGLSRLRVHEEYVDLDSVPLRRMPVLVELAVTLFNRLRVSPGQCPHLTSRASLISCPALRAKYAISPWNAW